MDTDMTGVVILTIIAVLVVAGVVLPFAHELPALRRHGRARRP
jgi:hypothetical protein